MKILIIHTFGLGDMIMFTPALQKLVEKYPNAKIDFLIFQKNASEPIKRFPNLNKIYYSTFRVKDIFHTLKLLRQTYYDMVITTSGTNPLKVGLFNLFIKSKMKIGEIKYNYQKIFFNKAVKYIENIHRVENNYLLVSNSQKIKYTPKFFRIQTEKKSDQKIVIGIHAGSNYKFRNRRWKKEYFVELINLLKKDYKKLEFLVFAGPDEFEESVYVSEKTQSNLIINKPLIEISRLISNCDIFINTDSGLGHIAGCFDIEIFTIFGPAKDYKIKVYNKNAYVIKLGLKCQPCYGTDKIKKCKDFKCLNDLKPNKVLDFIKNNSKILKNEK